MTDVRTCVAGLGDLGTGDLQVLEKVSNGSLMPLKNRSSRAGGRGGIAGPRECAVIPDVSACSAAPEGS